jgi:hypothetical protein
MEQEQFSDESAWGKETCKGCFVNRLREWKLVGATGFEPATLRSRIDHQLCPSLPFNNLRGRYYRALGHVLGILFPICSLLCSQNRALLFIIIYDNLGFQ